MAWLPKKLGKCIAVAGYVMQYACVAHCTFEYLGDFVLCYGPSMEPTIRSRDIVFTEKLTTRAQKLRVGDIVIARSSSKPQEFICKRIAGLPGQRIRRGLWMETVPPGHVWLLGDNAENSTDSRAYGAVPYGLIRSRAILRVWPLADIQVLSQRHSCPRLTE